jgi:hypothetical protein
VVTLYAPFDLVLQVKHSDARGIPEALLVGARVVPNTPPTAPEFKRLMVASPITHVTSDDPPFLMLHGDADTTVPIIQSSVMEAALKKAGVEAKFVTVPGGRHGNNFGFRPGDSRLPDDVKEAALWFDRHLHPKKVTRGSGTTCRRDPRSGAPSVLPLKLKPSRSKVHAVLSVRRLNQHLSLERIGATTMPWYQIETAAARRRRSQAIVSHKHLSP